MDWISKSILLVLVSMVLLRIAGRKSISQMSVASISTKKTVPASSTTLLKQNTVCFFIHSSVDLILLYFWVLPCTQIGYTQSTRNRIFVNFTIHLKHFPDHLTCQYISRFSMNHDLPPLHHV